MWTDNLVFYKKKSCLLFFVQVLAFTKSILIYQQTSITRYILTARTSSTHQCVRVIAWPDNYGQTNKYPRALH